MINPGDNPAPREVPDYVIETMLDGPDQVVAVKPPVEVPFREAMYEILNEMGLIKEIAIREGSFFETQHLPDGSTYSALRVSSTALRFTGHSIMELAHTSAGVLREQKKKVEISPYLLSAGGTQRLFERSKSNN